MTKGTSSLGAAFKAVRLGFIKNRDDPDKPRKPIPARPPTPQDAARPSIVNLSEDIILHIFDVVADTSPQSLPSLALVCASFNRYAHQVQFRNITIDLDDSRTGSLLEVLAADDRLLSSVRTLEVLSYGKCLESLLSYLSQLIVRMNGLRGLHWQGIEVPGTILKGLAESNPHVKLYAVVLDHWGENWHARQLLRSLAGSSLLFSLGVMASYRNAAQCLEFTQPLKRILLSCPNLRRLKIYLHLPRDDGCVQLGPPTEYPGIGLTGGERPPPLEELIIYDYPWGFDSDGALGFHCGGYPVEVPETEYWAETFDWSRLRHLELTDSVFVDSTMLLNRLRPKLRCLEHVSMGKIPYNSPIASSQRHFLEQVPSALQSICVPSLSCVGIAAITRHASTLKRLIIHQEELPNNKWEDDLMSDAALAELRDKLVNLQELAMDIGRDGNEWPSAKFDIIASFPYLQRLTLWFSLGNGRDHLPVPYVTRVSAAKIFSDLRQRSLGKSLRRLRVCSGCPAMPRPGIRGLSAYWAEKNSMSFVCELERDDEAARGKFGVTCLNLSKPLNERLERLVAGHEEDPLTGRASLPLKIARDGPMTLGEWRNLAYI